MSIALFAFCEKSAPYNGEMNKILTGDCVDLIKQLPDNSIRACITSPPYAEQRKNIYGGISEEKFPEWMVSWMTALRPKLTPDGSILINIRPHLRDGILSDYVLRTRLAIRETFCENEELIWLKPDAPPLGSQRRPRRVWESILWYSMTNNPFIDLFACGNQESTRIGFAGSNRFQTEEGNLIHGGLSEDIKAGTSRIPDVVKANVGDIERGILHPAMFPATLTDFLVQTFSEEGNWVLDPFAGSGTTLVSAKRFKRQFVGIEINPDYVKIAEDRLKPNDGLKIGKQKASSLLANVNWEF